MIACDVAGIGAMGTVLCLWYFDHDIHFKLLTEQADIDRAIALAGAFIGDCDEQTTDWLDELGFEMFRHDNLTQLPPVPNGAQVVVFFGY